MLGGVHDQATIPASRASDSLQRKIVRFGRAAGEDNFFRRTVEGGCDLFSGRLHGVSGFVSE